ncbi:MAG: Crp/Fnr family transcriptional regulator [Ferruginibacter sp.]
MTTAIKSTYLHSHPLFANVSEEKISAVADLMKVKTVSRGETISYGDGGYSKIYLLFFGKIKLAAFGDGEHELIKDIITSPDVFGNLCLDGKPSKDEYASALTNTAFIGMFTYLDFKELLQQNSMMAIAYANIVTEKLNRLEHRHSDLVFCDTKSRLINFIKKWAQSDGSKIGEKIILNNYLTHADIANSISSSRQSVNIILNELRDAGMLVYNRKQIELNNVFYLN